ncbi:hypothetical protein PV04_04640 [Phialophora macrospora]|uniref:Peptidase A1 domain-containing protein n=1 Tax=Phialophora macrospora TaxID=1851006 RepID=A0A0D2CU41_9EURO|nr:hypothetical protein PV04_04640 [Phialophora macrospora]
MTCANTASPLLLRWTNITVSSDNRALSRGIALELGSPPQILSLLPAIGNNNTFVFNAADCATSTNDSCIGPKGGVFDPSKSTTYRQTSQTTWNGSQTRELEGGSYIYFNDYLGVTTSSTIYGFPVFMDQYGRFQSGLGLGPSSTFLNATVNAGDAPTTSWGLWTGSRSVDNPVDGLLVIGGYDSARVAADFTEFKSRQDCYTCTEIVNMTYEWDGGSASLLSASEVMQISIEPYERSLPVRDDIFQTFLNVSGGYWDPDQGLIAYPVSNPPTGNLSVTLQGGYQTTIPASELFIAPRTYNSAGQYSISNDSILVSHIQNGTDPTKLIAWGIPFLTMNYLKVEWDRGAWSLAPAYRQDFGAVGGALVQPLCTGLTTPSPTVSPTSLPPSPNPTSTGLGSSSGSAASGSATPEPHHTNVGAIAGGVVGGVVGLTAILVLGWLFLRQRKRTRAAERRPDSAEPQPGVAAVYGDKSAAERTSTFTATSPTEHSELPTSPTLQHPRVNQWLSGQENLPGEATGDVT